MSEHAPRPLRTRQQIEAELHARLEHARLQYEKCKQDADAAQRLSEIGAASLGTPDGKLAIQKSNRHLLEVQHALAQYHLALTAFNDFILEGKPPKEQQE